MHPAETFRLHDLARTRAHALRDQAFEGAWQALFRTFRRVGSFLAACGTAGAPGANRPTTALAGPTSLATGAPGTAPGRAGRNAASRRSAAAAASHAARTASRRNSWTRARACSRSTL